MSGLYRALVEAGKHSVGCSSAHYQCEKESHHKALNSKRAVYVCEERHAFAHAITRPHEKASAPHRMTMPIGPDVRYGTFRRQLH